MQVLVTGAAGFLGSHVCERLVADGHVVTGADDLSTGAVANLAGARTRKGFALHHFDVASDLVHDLVRRTEPELVVHLAPVLPLQLLAAAARSGARVVVGGSAAVYGRTSGPVSERHGTHPATLAGARHAAVEAYVQAHAAQGLRATTLRLASVYGPRSRGVVTTWARALRAGRPTHVHGSGVAVLDLVHVDDVVDLVLRCLGGRADGRRLNVGSGSATTLRELHTLVAKAVGAPDAPLFAPAPADQLPASVVDAAAARRLLGWEAAVPLDVGLARTVDAVSRRT